MTTELTPEEKALRRRLRDALSELDLLTRERNLVYMSEEGPVDIDDVKGRLVFEVYEDYDDDDEEPTYILSSATDEDLESS
jgi:hypothetical protein